MNTYTLNNNEKKEPLGVTIGRLRTAITYNDPNKRAQVLLVKIENDLEKLGITFQFENGE